MRLIAVMDILGGVVVRAVGGRRDQYRPLTSQIARSPRPLDVAHGFLSLGLNEIYIADLDALLGSAPNEELFHQLGADGLYRESPLLWVDTGKQRSPLSPQVHKAGRTRHILPLESLDTMDEIGALQPEYDAFSLDLCGGSPLNNRATNIPTMPPLSLAARAVAAGFQTLFVIDVGGVGTAKGPRTLEICRAIKDRWPHVELISGGGVRDSCDLQSLADNGCDAALVSTALHNRNIDPTKATPAGTAKN